MKENWREKGCLRDRKILESIGERKALNIEQIKILFFNQKYGLRKAQERLLLLYKRGKVRRKKVNQSYVYFLEKEPGMLEHLININWIRIWLELGCASWEKVHAFSYESNYKILRSDGFMAIRNYVTGNFRLYILEMDMATNAFDKIKKYNELYENDLYQNSWWIKVANKFPKIIIVTISPSREQEILKKIIDENTSNLHFEVFQLEKIKREVNNLYEKTAYNSIC